MKKQFKPLLKEVAFLQSCIDDSRNSIQQSYINCIFDHDSDFHLRYLGSKTIYNLNKISNAIDDFIGNIEDCYEE